MKQRTCTRALATAAALALVAGAGPARAQDFVPFDQGTPAPKPKPQAKAKAKAKAKPASPTPPPTPAPPVATAGTAPATAPAAPAGAGAAPAAGKPTRRVLGVKLVDRKVEPYGASAVAPATRARPLDDPRNDRPSPALDGATGLVHLHTAQTGPLGSVRLALAGEVFAQSDFLVQGDHDSRQGLTFSVAWTPKRWLEAYASILFSSNTNSVSSPKLLQIQGDTALGAKGLWKVSDAFTLAADLRLSIYPSIGAIGYGAVGVTPRALMTFDARPVLHGFPLLAHVSLGFAADGTGNLAGTVQLTRVEEFALGIHRYDRVLAGVGVESPLPWVTPFVAWRMAAPTGLGALPTVKDAQGNLRQLTYGEIISHVLTLGARVTAVRDVTLMLSVDVGLNGAAIPGIPATMPWNFMAGLSYAFDPGSRSEKITETRERTVEIDKPVAVAPPTGFVAGTVTDAKTGKPLADAIVVSGSDGALPVASAPTTGAFRTHGLKPGKVSLTVSHEGYKPATASATVSAHHTAKLAFALVRKVETGSLSLTITGGRHHRPVAAQVQVKGAKEDVLHAAKDGTVRATLPPGKYTLDVTAPHYLARQKDLTLDEGGKVVVDVEMAPKPRRRLVIIRRHKLVLRRKIHFLSGRATILPDSDAILDQVIDLIATHGIKKLRIEGHTDSRGPAAFNLRLSQARADAVRQYLIEKGISPDRLQAQGFGETRPIAPNLTKRGRAMNRRVEFHIVDQ